MKNIGIKSWSTTCLGSLESSYNPHNHNHYLHQNLHIKIIAPNHIQNKYKQKYMDACNMICDDFLNSTRQVYSTGS